MKWQLGDSAVQLFGMWGLGHTIRYTFAWTLRLMRGNITRHTQVPASRIPMRSIDGGPASHALPGTPTPQHASLEPRDRVPVASSRD